MTVGSEKNNITNPENIALRGEEDSGFQDRALGFFLDDPVVTKRAFDFYIELTELERRIPDTDEAIAVRLAPSSPEWKRLKEAGVQLSPLGVVEITRGQLLGAGFVFLNVIGGGEKPLISSIIDINGVPHDLSQRVLLTQAELDSVLADQEEPDISNEDSRLLMLNFMSRALDAKRRETELERDFVKKYLPGIFAELTEEERPLVGRYLNSLDNIGWNYAPGEWLQGSTLLRVGQVPIDAFGSRQVILKDKTSPFLDSGYHFTDNWDITIYPDDPSKTRRLNMVVVHLLSRGLYERGGSRNGSHDQTYITPGEFLEVLKQATNDELFDEGGAVEMMKARLLARSGIRQK